jgi:hypothetical protein
VIELLGQVNKVNKAVSCDEDYNESLMELIDEPTHYRRYYEGLALVFDGCFIEQEVSFRSGTGKFMATFTKFQLWSTFHPCYSSSSSS